MTPYEELSVKINIVIVQQFLVRTLSVVRHSRVSYLTVPKNASMQGTCTRTDGITLLLSASMNNLSTVPGFSWNCCSITVSVHGELKTWAQ